jgi:hypothetical protein
MLRWLAFVGFLVMFYGSNCLGDDKVYFCKFDQEHPSVICVETDRQPRVFTFDVSVTPEFMSFLFGKPGPEPVFNDAFKSQLEKFRASMESLRQKAEQMQKASADLGLYNEVIATYKLGILLFYSARDVYQKRSPGWGGIRK